MGKMRKKTEGPKNFILKALCLMLKALCFILKALCLIQRNRDIFMFSVKIDGHLLKGEGHKAQHYHEVGPIKGSHLMVVLGYFKVVGPEKKQKKRRKERGERGESWREDREVTTMLAAIPSMHKHN